MSLYDEAILIQKPSGYKAEKLYNVMPSPEVTEQSSVEFDGVDDCLITDGDSVAQPTTYSFWAKSTETGTNKGVFGHGFYNIGAFHFNWNGTQPLLYLGSGYFRHWAANSAQDDGEWHHWVVYSDTNDVTNSKLYCDGVLQTASTSSSTGSLNAYTEGLTIGSDRQSSGYYFNGSISDFAVFSRELNQSDVTEIYNYGSPNDLLETSFVNDLDLYYQMGDGILDSYPLIADQTNATLGSELSPNYSCDDNITGWSGYNSTVSHETTITYGSSSGSLKSVLAGGNSWIAKSTSDISGLSEGDIVKATAKVYIPSGWDGGDIWFQGASWSGRTEWYTKTSASITDEWQDVTYYAKLGSDVTGPIYLRGSVSSSAGMVIYFDNISIKAYNGNPAVMTNMSSDDIVAWTPNIETDFDVARSSTTTRINASGYIEQVAANVPRLNYDSGDSCPYLLTEAASTNLITYPISFGNSYWTKSGATIEGDSSTAGAELWDADAAAFTSGTYSWVAVTNNTIANVSNTLSITYVDDANGASCGLRDSRDLNADLVVGQMYKFSATVYYTGGAAGARIRLYDNTAYNYPTSDPTTTPQTLTIYFTAQSTTNCFISFVGISAGNVVTIDNLSLTAVTGFSSPSIDYPLEAYKLVESSVDELHRMLHAAINVTATNEYIVSVYVKQGENKYFQFFHSQGGGHANFDLENGVIGSIDATFSNSTITPMANDWYRCSAMITAPSTAGIGIYFSMVSSSTAARAETYLGDGTSGVYIAFAQVEALSYPTSLMLPTTEGSTTSRVADAITNAGNQSLFSSVNSSGVLYAEIAANSDDLTYRQMAISDGTNSNYVRLYYDPASNTITARITVATVSVAEISYTVSDPTVFAKCAVRWRVNDFSLWTNGVERGTDVSGVSFAASTLTEFSFDGGGGTENFYGKTKAVGVFDYLSDAEMVTLTT